MLILNTMHWHSSIHVNMDNECSEYCVGIYDLAPLPIIAVLQLCIIQ